MQLYTATSCNGTFTQDASVNCFSGGEISFGITAGTLYYMRISNTANNPNFSFTTCVTVKYPAANQRVGINTKTPQYNFDVKGRAFFTDSTEFLRSVKFYSGIEVSNALKLALPFAASNKILMSDAVGNASWQNLNIPAAQWTASGNNIYNSNAGNVGIGNLNPDAPLSFLNATGNKIALYSSGVSAQYGFGVQGNLLQIYSDVAASDIAFGYGGSNSFTEKARITGNGNMGIGTSVPLARLHVADSNVVFTGAASLPANPVNPPVSGPGIRMMWYPDKAAFRAGYAFGTTWDKGNIGNYSFATGNGSLASGTGSFANGVALAYGNYSSSMGTSWAVGAFSVALCASTSTGEYSVSAGYQTNAKGAASVAVGSYNDQTDNPSALFSGVLPSDRVFQIGNGTGSSRSNAMTVLRNGNVGIGNLAPAKPLSFPASLGEKILLYPGAAGEVGIGVYGNELRLHADNPGAKVSFGTQDNAGTFSENALAQRNGVYAFSVLGSLWVNGTTYASDERFKQNISPISSPIQKLLQLKGVEYEMRIKEFPQYHFTAGRQMGLLAQNVETVVPEAVNEKDGYKGVDYARLVPLLIESIKEQQKQIEEFIRINEKMQQQMDALNRLVTELQKNKSESQK
jgi:hypothetical protein